ncbi:ATP-binding protein [Nocardia lasii]|uniref:ATP-binding protein n=1 Tax=Nocardia lasii TaxID=1616107 RepID=A0ABW1JN88_9NOCA
MDPNDRIITDSTPTTAVQVRVDADLTQIVMLRALTETVALIAGFDVDEVADMRVALDESATCLVLGAVPGSSVRCEVLADDFRITVAVHGVCADPAPMDTAGFGWHVLHSITDHLDTTHAPFDRTLGGYPVAVSFTQIRRVR